MKWIERTEGHHFSNPYRLARDVHGYSAWIYSKRRSGCLGRGMTLARAKQICEEDSDRARRVVAGGDKS